MRNLVNVMAILQEECAEVIQAVSKINRFGMNSEWQGKSNKESLIMELGDVIATIDILLEETDINISRDDVEKAVKAKKNKLEVYLPHET